MAIVKYKCTVRENSALTASVFELKFSTDAALEFKPGQFVSIIVPNASASGKDIRRAYSIASPPQRRPIELCIKKVENGPGTQYLHKLKAGDQFDCLAPYGKFIYLEKPERHVCFVSTGTGIAPFYSMIFSDEFKRSPPLSTLCLLGVSYEEEILYHNDISKVSNVEWVPCISRSKEWGGFRGRVTDYLRSLPEYPWTDTDFYLCGGGDMIKEVKEILLSKGVEKTSIHQEAYF